MAVWRNAKAEKAIAALPPDERLERARARLNRLVGHVRASFLMHEANAIALYSTTLVEQIPRSYAARAFDQFQRSMYLHELVRLAAIWDDLGTHRQSIPMVVALFNHPAIVDRLVGEARARYADMAEPFDGLEPAPGDEWKREWWLAYRDRRAEEEAEKTRQALAEAVRRSGEILASNQMKALRDLRDQHIAHNLDVDEGSVLEAGEAQVWRYGGESTILTWTVEVCGLLHYGLTGSSFAWDDARAQSKRNAEELWSGCRFDILDRSRCLSTGD